MKKKNTALAGALLLVLAGWSAADAAEIYTLDPVIVTAERTDTKELKTPAAVEIITDKQIRETGAANMQEALKFSTGIITSSQGPRGLSRMSMLSEQKPITKNSTTKEEPTATKTGSSPSMTSHGFPSLKAVGD